MPEAAGVLLYCFSVIKTIGLAGGFDLLYCFSVKKPPAEPVCSRIALALRAKKKLHAIVLRGSPTALP